MTTTTTTTTSAGRYVNGYCACGRLKYKINCDDLDANLTLSAYCHCSRCQRINGAPFVHSLHLKYPAVIWDPTPERRDDDPAKAPETGFSPQVQTYEALPGKKWKVRCKTCGSPMGTWNGERAKWTIWPNTIARKSTAEGAPSGNLAEGPFDIPSDLVHRFKASHHQFYGPWRSMNLDDGLDKYVGYKDISQKVNSAGEPLP